jgi:hypothetical protein
VKIKKLLSRDSFFNSEASIVLEERTGMREREIAIFMIHRHGGKKCTGDTRG